VAIECLQIDRLGNFTRAKMRDGKNLWGRLLGLSLRPASRMARR
jgi:hypothetical protein